jgi:hypothetical protein
MPWKGSMEVDVIWLGIETAIPRYHGLHLPYGFIEVTRIKNANQLSDW